MYVNTLVPAGVNGQCNKELLMEKSCLGLCYVRSSAVRATEHTARRASSASTLSNIIITVMYAVDVETVLACTAARDVGGIPEVVYRLQGTCPSLCLL